jgi:hypothetical protein
MNTPYSLFVKEYSDRCLFGIGIIISKGAAAPAAHKLTGTYQGYINGNDKYEVTWHHFQELVTPPTDNDEKAYARHVSGSLIRFKVAGAVDAIHPPCIILPFSYGKPCVTQVKVTIEIASLSETSGFQCYLWVATAANVLYEGLLGEESHPLLYQTARKTLPRTGDAFPVFLSDVMCVLLLGAEIKGNLFEASLWTPGEAVEVGQQLPLISKVICEVGGTTGTFQTLLATTR